MSFCHPKVRFRTNFLSSKSKWFLFDDEVVSSIDDLNAPDKYDEEEEVMSKKSIKNKLAAGFTRGKNGDV